MSILLVSRGTMSGGEATGECLSRTMGFRYLTREQLTAEINTHGELATRVLERLPQATRDYARFSALRRAYKTLMRMAVLDAARHGERPPATPGPALPRRSPRPRCRRRWPTLGSPCRYFR